MVKKLYYDGRAFALGVVGAATVLATMAGEFLMHNVAFAEDWHSCPDLSCTARTGTGVSLTYPATAVILPNGSTLDITIYQVIVLALGALIFLGALACAAWTMRISRGVLAVAALLLALTLVFFHGQPPMMQKFPIGGCDASCFTHPELVPYQPIVPGDPLIDSFWFMVPAAALGLLTAGLALLPAARRRAMS